MSGKGGYQPPKHPAVASGPGAMSQRTDGGPADQKARWIPQDQYGGATELMGIQRGAPMEASPEPVPLHAPTQYPHEPVTAGAARGPGPGPEVLPNAPAPTGQPDDVAVIIRAAYAAHPSPELGALMNHLEAQGR